MISLWKWTLTLCLVCGLAGFALAQQRQGGGPGGLIFNPQVKKELKLTDDQVSKLMDSLSKVGEKLKGSFDNIQKKPFAEQRKAMQSASDSIHKAIADVLDDKQMKRYKQIEWQMAGPGAIFDLQLQKELNLSDEQKKKLETILEDMDKQMKDLRQPGGDTSSAQQKAEKIFKDTQEKANGVLTDEQKKKWKDSLGEEFKMQQQPGGRSR